MRSIQATARYAGFLYVLFSLLAIFGYMYVPGHFVVSGDPAATARNIMEETLLYRAGILASLAGHITFIFLVLALYDLFRDVDRKKARLMVALVCAGAAGEIVNLANRAAPLVLLGGADWLSVFPQPQLDALAFGFVRLGNQLGQLIGAFWGVWLFPFGLLTIQSGYFPRVLGILQIVAGIGYTAACVIRLLSPELMRTISPFMTPLYIGELPMVLWLLVMGAKVPRAETPRAA